jgi:hypothetical protein
MSEQNVTNRRDVEQAKAQWAVCRKLLKTKRFGRVSWRRCYWTWPFGHVWKQVGCSSYTVECVVCGKPRTLDSDELLRFYLDPDNQT